MDCKCLCSEGHYMLYVALNLTARQYGEVVLPDAASGQGPGTLAGEPSRWQDRYGVLFAVQIQFLLGAGAIAVLD